MHEETDILDWLDRFENSWQTESTVTVAELFGEARQVLPPDMHRELLVELIALDIEHRWKQAAGDHTRYAAVTAGFLVEDYFCQFSDVLADTELQLCVCEEFRARHRWGDHPPISDYQQRFGDRVNQIHIPLGQVLESLASEAAEAAPCTEVELEIIEGPAIGRKQVFHDAVNVVGRSPDCHWRLDMDPNVSRRHFAIHLEQTGCRIVDLRSKNGTFLNGERIEESALSHGDLIAVGPMLLRVSIYDQI